ncbi:uncharacterized protein LOC127710040 [Mytilus californianus]|uniref:uncharacterized protein LOC127710040 n=1 Tax=Mytilus californianus TaxID=6549 RepID=UPI0022481064|nr:uncharacterized protein LOC127710040 [Mytilus californianus]
MIICECILGSTSITQHIVHDIKCLDFTCKDENNDDQPCGMSSVKAFYSHDVINFDSTNVMLIDTVANLADHEYSKTFTVEIGNGKGENKIISGVLLSEINFGISNFTFEFSGESCSYNDSFQRYTEFDLKVFEASTVHVIEPLRTSCFRLTIYPSGDTPPDNPRCRITLYEPYDDYVTAERIGIYGYYHNSEIDTSDIYTADYLTSSLNDYSSMSTEQVLSQITTQMPVSSEIGFTMITSQLETNNLPSSHMDTATLTISQLGTSILPTSHIDTATLTISQLGTSILPTSHIDTATLTISQLGTSILPSSHMDTAALTISQLGTSILPTSHMDTATLIASQGITGTTSSTTVNTDDHTPTAEKTTQPVNSHGHFDNLTCFSFCYHKYHNNLTAEQVENIRDEIRQLLLVDTKTLSSQIRRKISVKDKRPSATIIGTIPIVILLALLGCIVLSDLNTIRGQVYCMVKNVKGLYSSI